MKKGLNVFFIFMLILQSMFASISLSNSVDAEAVKQDVIKKDVSYQDESGNPIEDIKAHEGYIKILIDWSIVDQEMHAGDQIQLDLSIPEKVILDGNQSAELVFVDVAGDAYSIATYEVSTDGITTVTFTEEAERIEAEVMEGTFTLDGEVEAIEDAKEESGESKDAQSKIEGNASMSNKSEIEKSEVDVDKEVEKEAAETKDAKESKSANKSKNAIQANEEEFGFSLELGEVTDLAGNRYTEESLLDLEDEFRLKLDWTLEDGHNYKAGDIKTFELPKGINIQENINMELRDASGQLVANTVVTSDKTVELTFTDFVENHSDVNGWMEIISTLDIEEVEVEDGKAILDPIGEEDELRIPIDEGDKSKTIEKKGSPNKGYKADEINWEVIINKNTTSLQNAKVTDELPEGTTYKDGSLKVTKLRVDLYGNVLGDLEEVEITPEISEDGELIIPLGDTNDAYKIEYITEVTDDDKKNFKNNAKLIDDELDDVSAYSTITINRGEPIKKKAATGYDPKTGIIEWEIEFNYNQKSLSDTTLKDMWTPKGMLELVEDSLRFQEVSIDENGNAHREGDAVNLPEGAVLNEVDDGFEVTDISTDKAYKVTYQTKVKDRVLDPVDVSNTAEFGNESDGSGTYVGQFYGSKSAGEIDYAEKTIEWTIKVNQDEYPMEDISIEDTLGEGLTLLEDSMIVTVGGEQYDNHTISDDNPFTINFSADYTTDKEIIITYKTEFDADSVSDHKPTNVAAITWTPEGEDDSITKEVEDGTELNKETKDSSWKNGFYNPETKEITWEIFVNYRENDIADLIIKDEPQGNQQIIDGSAEVKELNIAANGSHIDGDTVENAATIDEEANTIDVNLGETNKAYKITFKTSLEGLADMQDEYVNEAEVFDGDQSISKIDAKVGIVKDRKYGNKSGYQDGKQVHWSIDVNLVQQKIQDLKLVDEISDNQEYLKDSIKVYHANIDGNGHASKGEEVSSDDYELSVNQDEGEFSIKWKDEVERGFIVEYSTLFFEKHGDDVRNNYTITGDSIEEEDSDASDSYNVIISQLGSGGGDGTAGYLVIDKLDTSHGQVETHLAGAEFDLIDADTGNVLKSGTTDENGQIDFGRLLFGDYKLVETKIPEGYVTPEEEQTITIDEEYKLGDDKEGFAYTVENYEPVFAIELSKKDDEGYALEDAEFTLFDSNDREIDKATTNEDGKILFEGLGESGTYYVLETKAPAGYILDETKHGVEVGQKEKEPIKVIVDNTPRGSVLLTKSDVDTNKTLAGVEFELQRKNESGEYEKVETYTTDENGQIQTSNTLQAGDYQFVETKALEGYRTNKETIEFEVNVYDSNTQTFSMTNEKYKGAIKLLKTDAATEELLTGAEFNLVNSKNEVIQENLVTNDEGEIVLEDLLLGTYQLIETKAPEGYELDETPIDIEVTEDNQVVERTMTNNKITDITVEKKWNNNDGDTEPVTVNLLPTDKKVELNEENNWKATFKDLDVYDEDGKEIVYHVEELDVDGYNSEVTGDASDGFVVTNTETTSVSGKKTWKDDDSDERPDQITVKLLADGEKAEQKEVTAKDNWKYEFNDLNKYDEDGKEINYTIDEVKVDGYETTVDGFDITNLRVGETEVSGTKTWLDDESEERPEEIIVQLLANGEETDKTVSVDANSNWKYAFTELDKYDNQGKEIEYTVDEEEVDGYEKSIDVHDITNLRVGKTDVTGEKVWNEVDERYRPDSITVQLLANGEKQDTIEVSDETNWLYAFTGLDKYDDQGKEINYTIEEQDVPMGYESAVEGFDITNTQKTTNISGTKTWLDDNSNNRPNAITVLVKNGDEKVVEKEVTAKDNWEYTFTDLAKYDKDGNEIDYTIGEKDIDGYDKSIDGTDITNTRIGETELTVTKNWVDENKGDRPNTIRVNLIQNGDFYKEYEVTEEADWKLTIKDLPKYDSKGVAYEYTITEHDVPGYDSEIDGFDITNTRADDKSVEITKTWLDDDAEGRPNTIEIELFRSIKDGDKELVDVYTLKAEDKWTLIVGNLPAFNADGKAYTYKIAEKPVEGYETSINGFDITNVRTGTTSIDVEKVWENDKEKDRPDAIVVDLLQNNEVIETIEITEEDDWVYQFTDLEAYDEAGKEYDYIVAEHDIDGYESTISEVKSGYTITNTFMEDPEKTETNKKDPEDLTKHKSYPRDQDSSDKATDNDDGDKEGFLPSTATNILNMIVAGALLMVAGTGITLYRRRKA